MQPLHDFEPLEFHLKAQRNQRLKQLFLVFRTFYIAPKFNIYRITNYCSIIPDTSLNKP